MVPELLWELKQVAPRRAARLQKQFDALPEDDPDGIAGDIWNDAIDALQEFAPPFCYVGAIEGDGADIGVWWDHDAFRRSVEEGET